MNAYESMSREELLAALDMFAKNWLAHDGCWFLATEAEEGMERAIHLDTEAWRMFAKVEAKRIKKVFRLPEAGGLEALAQALDRRMYAVLNTQHMEWSEDRTRLRFFMDSCRVQDARRRKGLPDFPCAPVGLVEFETFTRAIDPRIRVHCIQCPPDTPEGSYCGWEFTLTE